MKKRYRKGGINEAVKKCKTRHGRTIYVISSNSASLCHNLLPSSNLVNSSPAERVRANNEGIRDGLEMGLGVKKLT